MTRPGRARGAAADGAELIGTTAPGWTVKDWLRPALLWSELRGKVVLVRWFSSPDCPHTGAR